MKKNLLFTLLVFFISCKQNKIEDATYFTYKDFGNQIELKGEIIISENIMKPNRIFFTDSLLITVEDNSYFDCFAQIYNPNNLTPMVENIPKGIGPNERLNCWTLQINSDYIWAFDMQTQKMTAYPKDDFLTTSKISPYKVSTLDGAVVGIVSLSNKTFVASNLADTENLLSLYDYNGIKKDSIKSPFPKLRINNEEVSRKRLFENRIQYNEKNNKIVVFYVYTDIIDIYDEKLNLLSRIHGPDFFLPKLGMRGNFVHVERDKTKFTYTLGYLTSEEIWALYYGVSPEKDLEMPSRLFVFDYNGKPLRRYKLEYPISTFCVDENNRFIYGLSEQPESCIVKFALEEK